MSYVMYVMSGLSELKADATVQPTKIKRCGTARYEDNVADCIYGICVEEYEVVNSIIGDNEVYGVA